MSDLDGLRSAAPHLDWEAIERTLLEGAALPKSRPPTFAEIYQQRTGRDMLFTGVVVSHEFQCAWKVVTVKSGRVTWRCWCGKRQERQVRVYGILPARYLLARRAQWQSAVPSAALS